MTLAVGDVVLLRGDIERHRPPRRLRVDELQGSDVRASWVTADLDDCPFCQSIREDQVRNDDGTYSAGWWGVSAIAAPIEQGALW